MVPAAPDGWDSSIVVASQPKAQASQGELSLGDTPFVSIGVGNMGEDLLAQGFFVDLYFDEYFVQRFPSRRPLPSRSIIAWDDWTFLAEFVRLTPGDHTLRVVADPTNLVTELDESDNVVQLSVVWRGDEQPSAATATRAPNLQFYTPDGWDAPLVATSYASATASGPLSVDAVSYIRYALVNRGLSSIAGRVLVDLYLDDIFLLRESWAHILADGAVDREPWSLLHETVRLEPGRHMLKVVLDPTDLIAETDEGDNVLTKEFIWAEGDVPPRSVVIAATLQPAAPDVLTLPNLVPGWLWQWDGPIVVSTQPGTHVDSQMTTLSGAFIDLVIFNESIVDATEPFAIDLYFDGRKVNTFQMSGTTWAKVFRIREDWDGLLRSVQVSEGPHTLRLVVDPDDTVREANESDNLYEKTVVWRDLEEPAKPPVTYTLAQLTSMLSGLQALLDTREPLRQEGERGHSEAALRVVDAGYYLITGRSLKDEKVDIFLLPRDEYLAWIDDSYRERFAVSDETHYEWLLRGRERDKTISVAKKERRFGKIVIVVDASRQVADVLNSLVHETGHVLQDLQNPAQTEAGDSLELSAVREAQAQQFERAFWLVVEEFTGRRYLRYPDYPGFETFIDARLTSLVQEMPESEHALGRLLQWLAVLDDPNLARLKAELFTTGRLGASASLALFDYLVQMPPEAALEYVPSRFESLRDNLAAIAGLAKSRLEAGLPVGAEGSADLREPALLAP
ncbi:MAG: hypothetical protein FJ312_05985 [SAR202 cluster bacterium]|nr:hypothetical protein [SAR202 cluster bacterium]